MEHNLSYLAHMFGATLIEYRHRVRSCFLSQDSRDKCYEFAEVANMIILTAAYWEDFKCYTLEKKCSSD